MITVAPSILSADFGYLTNILDDIAKVTDHCHLDIMDGHFVPNITIGPPVVKSLRKHSNLYFDCHLMIESPGKYLESFKEAGADLTTVHIEVGKTLELIDQMEDLQLSKGLALNPDTDFSHVVPYLEKVDLLLIMSVFPGFGGQTFMLEALDKLRLASKYREENNLSFRIEVDGGVNLLTAPGCIDAGADILVVGSAIFESEQPIGIISALKSLAIGIRH